MEHHSVYRPPMRIVPLPKDPNVTTSANFTSQLQALDAVARIQQALIDIGVHPAAAREHAVACVQRNNADLRPLVEMHVAEQVWRASVGDLDGLRSMVAYAASGEGPRRQVAKILADVRAVLADEHRCYADQWTARERIRAAAHTADWQRQCAAATSVQADADRIVERLVPVRAWARDVSGVGIHEDGGNVAS